ncbi:hypothetical protein C2S52_018450 [Perilla frutescens var. hirtella]|nr:hypothetical protein C2S52_018450 [Perilla frutescens var. hirtella]
MSAQNKKNSTSNKDCRVNRGGAISISERRRRYEKALGRTVSIPQVFQKINFDEKKDKWLTPAAENIYHTFKKMKEDSSSQGKNVDDSAIFLKASGGKKMAGRSDLGQKWHSMVLDLASILELPNLAQWKLSSSKNVCNNWRN